MDSVGEGEGGKIWENGIETCKISCMKLKKKKKKKRKPDTEDHSFYDSIYRQCSEKAKFIKTESRLVVIQAWG